MRFVLAIAAFVAAAAMIVLGIAQRTVFLPPAAVSYDVTVPGDAAFTVIDGETMTALPGKQSVTATGSDTVFVAYGRTGDVTAWLGDEAYNTITFNDDKTELVATTHEATEPEPDATATPDPEATETPEPEATDDTNEQDAGPNPAGSDLWLMENIEEEAVIAPMNIPEGVSVLIASDGTHPAPSQLKLTWPSDNSTPWAGPLIVGGIIMIIVGLILYLLGINHLRRSRGPRRKGIDQGRKRGILGRGSRPRALTAGKGAGRGRLRMAVVPVVLVGAISLSGCSQAFWPDFTPDPRLSETPTPTATADDEELPPPSVSVPQLERIMADVSAVATEADSARDADLAATRFAGAALKERTANYKIREKISDYSAPAPIPAAPLTISLPKATETWPRTVIAMVKDEDPTVAPTSVVLRQETPRDNYKVVYTQRLEPDAVVPQLAPASVGAASIPADSAWLTMAPGEVAAAYADIVAKGDESEFASKFDVSNDTLISAIASDRETKKKELPDTATISFSTTAGDAKPVSLATLNSGALVAVNMHEVETVKPKEDGALIKIEGTTMAALAGLDETAKGIESTYSDQLLFYVPPADSEAKITLLGFSQGLLSATELK
ncbi:hypothetical protein [Paramicrobacterium agarici]|uniref:DUF8094 domain-containing protein n=1 Tax=Paramicrobacterium agarici TaxID=630514 RepID=A0A2A9DZV5_9MICO|nr:hypothetical protein [Microbacterium agarici]PFG31502.1 hypothetical protein ATJ78_2472 [Microbacterium agarici]TQO21390.1 hypothetical protein FB385_0191 [Microbacterium agarici]